MADLVEGARVTAGQITEVISTELGDTTIHAFINTAHRLLDSKATAMTTLGEDLLTEIELWLSAHFLAMRERQAQTEKIDEYSVTFMGTSGMGLQATQYGQQALALDWTGTLAGLGKQQAEIRLV
jgi:hypothetical protein